MSIVPHDDWFTDDSFWETFEFAMFTPARFESVPEEIDGVLALTDTYPGARVLDLCCGPGRHTLELCRRGYHVTGVDRTKHYLDKLRASADKEGLTPDLVQSDMREFVRPTAFDLAINMYTSFGYFEDPEEDVRVARNIYESLRPGGVLLLETMGKERLANIWRDSNWRREEGGTIVIEERRITRDWTWIENTWTIIREGRQRTFAVAHRVYSAAEIKTLFGACGFGDIKVFGSLQGDPYDNNATRLVMAARK